MSCNMISFCYSYLFRSGHREHPDDKFFNTIVEIRPETADDNHFIQVGDFNSEGIATKELDPKYGKIGAIRLKVLQSSENWVVLSEVRTKEALLPINSKNVSQLFVTISSFKNRIDIFV